MRWCRLKLNILIADPVAYGGGIGTSVAALASHFTRLGHRVTLASPRRNRPNSSAEVDPCVEWINWPKNDEVDLSVKLLLKGQSLGLLLKKPLLEVYFEEKREALARKALLKFVQDKRFDHCLFPGVVGWSACRLRIPSSCMIHDLNWNHYPDNFPGKSPDRLNSNVKAWIQKTDIAFCVSEATRKEVLELFPWASNKLVAIPHGFTIPDKAIERPNSELASLVRDCEFLLYPSSVGSHKGHDTLLKAFAIVRKQLPNLKLVLTGGRTDEIPTPDANASPSFLRVHETYKLIRQAVGDGIIFAGSVDAATLDWLYRHCSLVALPTEYEGFGLPLLEAWAVSAPVVATRINAFEEIAKRYGEPTPTVYVEPMNEQAMAKAILSHSLSFGGGRISRVADLSGWSWESAATAYIDEIEKHMEIRKVL